jgi:hypothetical protein
MLRQSDIIFAKDITLGITLNLSEVKRYEKKTLLIFGSAVWYCIYQVITSANQMPI